jgi:hypothetical protein
MLSPYQSGRDDHFLPRGYLRGFIDPIRAKFQRPLWVFYIQNGIWRERSVSQIGYIEGLYDLPPEGQHLESADATFMRLENDFPRIRDRIISDQFESWADHQDFLLQYMQMMRARSPLYFSQTERELATVRQAKILAVEDLGDGTSKLTVDTMNPYPLTAPEVRMALIGRMRDEIRKGADWLSQYHWALRYTDSTDEPAVATETTFVSIGQRDHLSVEATLADSDTYLCFPFCWQACLIGTRHVPTHVTRRFQPYELEDIRRAYINNGQQFLISPRKLHIKKRQG